MSESFAQLFEESLKGLETRQGSIVSGTVVAIQKGFVLVDAGLKSESAIPVAEFQNAQGELEVKVGDTVNVALDAVEDGYGETKLSREKAVRHESWIELEKAYEEKATVIGLINGKVKGGFTVELNGVRAFLPGSLVDTRPAREADHLLGKELEFKVIKLDQKRNNVVVSRRAVIESENSQEREQILENLAEGSEVKGIVKNLTDYGAFVDLGGVDGLLHITDMAWKRVKHPSEIVNVGDEVTVKVLKFDKDRTRVSLGLKQLGQDPWVAIAENHPVNSKLTGKVTNLTDYGCFVEILDGVEGLVHVSEMDWTNKNIHPSKVVSLGGLEGGIDGLVHLSDISWNVAGEEAVRNYKKGDEVSAVVLAVDAVKERISLGIKQLEDDPFNNFVAVNKKGAVVSATVVEADAKGAKVELAGGVEGYIRAADLTNEVAAGDVVEAKYTGVDRKARIVHLSVKAKDQAEEAAAVANVNTKQEDVAIPNAMAEAFKAAKGE